MNDTTRIAQASKNGQVQITVPKVLASSLGIGKGTPVCFRLGANKTLVMWVKRSDEQEQFAEQEKEAQQVLNRLKDEAYVQNNTTGND